MQFYHASCGSAHHIVLRFPLFSSLMSTYLPKGNIPLSDVSMQNIFLVAHSHEHWYYKLPPPNEDDSLGKLIQLLKQAKSFNLFFLKKTRNLLQCMLPIFTWFLK